MYCPYYYNPFHVLVEKDFYDYMEIYLSVIVPIITMYLGYKISDNSIKKQERRKFNRVYQYFKNYYKNLFSALHFFLDLSFNVHF